MAFFTIQNHDVGIKNEQASMEPVIIGDAARSFNGSPLSTRRSIKRDWTVTSALQPADDARFMIALIQGMGHTWSFDDVDTNDEYLYSSKGQRATGGVSSATRNTSNTKFGAARLQLDAGSNIVWPLGYDFEWTIMLWKGTAGGVYTHYIVNSAGHKWVDGVRNDAASTPFMGIASGTLGIGDLGAGAAQYFDDVVVIEEDITDAWAEDFGSMASAFGAMPKFEVRGDMVLNHRYRVEAYDLKVTYTAAFWEGTWNSDLMEVTFTMHEFSRES